MCSGLGRALCRRWDRVASACRREPSLIVARPVELHTKAGDAFLPLAQALGRVGQAGGKRVEPLGVPGEAARKLAGNAAPELPQVREQGVAVRAEDLGGGGRRCRAQVGGEVGDGEVGFMADPGNHRQPAGADGTRHDFLVERPQILDAAAAPAQDDRIAIAGGGKLQGGGDPVGGAFALDRRGEEIDADMRRAPAQRGQDVAQGRRLRAGDDGQRPRVFGQGALDLGGEQSFGLESRPETEEALEQVALAGAADRFDVG